MLSWLLMVNLAEAKKAKAPPPPPVGWAKEEGWAGDCYYPKDLSKLSEIDRRMERSPMVEAMQSQWSGGRDDGVSFDEIMVARLNEVLMSKPTAVEAVAAGNLEQCMAFRKGGPVSVWEDYLRALPAQLTEGDCTKPLTYTLFNYLDIGSGWQQPIPMCKENRAHIFATASDKYRITDNGPWITAAGDPAIRSIDPQYPCHDNENCFAGQLIGRFETSKGVEIIFPIGVDTVFRAPENGTLYISINDYNWFDNRYFKTVAIEDRTSVTIEPAQ